MTSSEIKQTLSKANLRKIKSSIQNQDIGKVQVDFDDSNMAKQIVELPIQTSCATIAAMEPQDEEILHNGS